MVFDTEIMAQLREKYANVPDFRVPTIVFLDRSDELAGERAWIEEIIESIPISVRKDWIARLLSVDHTQHKGVWFQMLLTPWLQQVGQTVVEPTISGNNPDFLVRVGEQEIVVEARAFLVDEAKREREIRDHEVIWILNEIQRPYAVTIKKLNLTTQVDPDSFRTQVVEWLDKTPDDTFRYEDRTGNHIVLTAQHSASFGKVGTLGPTRMFRGDSSSLKSPLRKKAGQHQAIRGTGYPYVIAIYLEDRTRSAKQVVEAWFGKEEAIVDVESDTVIDQRIDLSGIHFFSNDVLHTSVSGTLVFRAIFDGPLQRHRLRAWYIQNPFAKQPIDPTIFPVEARFVVKEQTSNSYRMQWEHT